MSVSSLILSLAMTVLRSRLLLCGLALFALSASAAALTDLVPAPTTVTDDAITWMPAVQHTGLLVILTGADGEEARRAFAADETATFTTADVARLGMADGEYRVDVVVMTGEVSTGAPDATVGLSQTSRIAIEAGTLRELSGPVITGNQTIRQALCVGLNCADAESYGATDVLLKADNLSVRFDDTSTTAGFPANDWELLANDSHNGGEDYFGIRDITAATTPFRVDAGVATDGLRVSPAGSGTHVGVGTEPMEAIHAVTSDTPTLRLEQQSTSFGDYAWDLGGYESYFYLRDGGSGDFPFFVGAGAANGALAIEADDVILGFSGVPVNLVTTGTTSLAGAAFLSDSLVVDGPTLTQRTLVGFDDPTTAAANTEFEVDGFARFRADTRFDGTMTAFGDFVTNGDLTGRGKLNFVGDYSALAGPVIRVRDQPTSTNYMILTRQGDLTILGTLSQGSDVNRKEEIVAVDPEAILDGVSALPISTWQYIGDEEGGTHLGPMAQDFYRAFGLGQGETTIASIDADGVALASVQALRARNEAAVARIAELEAENAAQAERLARLEAAVARLSAQN